MADMIRRQNPNAAITMESQVNSALSPPMAQSVSGGSGGGSAPMSLLTEEGQAAFDAKEAMRMRSQDFSGEERAIEAQMAMAEQMRTGKSPQGRTVGPLDVYVGPNWGEVAGDFATKIGGGYFGKKAAEKDAALDERRTDVRLGKSMIEEQRYQTGDAREVAKLKLLQDAGEREKIKDKVYTEFTNGENTKRGYTLNGVGYDENDKRLPEGYSEKRKVTGQSSIPFSPITEKDEYGNTVITSYNKGDNSLGIPRFIDGTPYSPEEAQARANRTAQQAGDVEGAKGNAKSLVEQYGDAAAGLMANNAAIGQYKIAKEAIKNGAQTGPIADWLPTFRKESIKLQNARDSQALTQIAQYTFGSLSEAEGDWLKDTSIPLNLEEDALDEWIDKRVEGFERANKAESYRLDMINAGHQPDPIVEAEIKYGGGFTWE